MYILEVIPLTVLPPNVPQLLSYFFDRELPKGAVVQVSLNRRTVPAVVVSSVSLDKEKVSVKKADFQVKKLTKVLFAESQVSDRQLKLAAWTARRYHAPLGYTLKAILPPFAFKKKYPMPFAGSSASQSEKLSAGEKSSGKISEELIIYKTKNLARELKPLVEKTLTGGKQVLLVAAEKSAIDYFASEIKNDPAILHSGLPNKDQYQVWQKCFSGKGFFIGTRQTLHLPWPNLGLIILDDPNNEFYKSDMAPKYHAAEMARRVAEMTGAKLLTTAVAPGVERFKKILDGEIKTGNADSRPKFEIGVSDTGRELKDGNRSVLSRELAADLIERLKAGKKVLIYSPRRGWGGIVVCDNCNGTVRCRKCETPMRVHRSVDLILTCHHCGVVAPLPSQCPACASKNIKIVGPAGTQKIYEQIKRRLVSEGVKAVVLAMDADIAKNEAEEEEIVSEISKPGPAALIATQAVLSHRFRIGFDLIGLVNADALANAPDFRSEENLVYNFEKLVGFLPAQGGKIVIQTHNPENRLFARLASGDYDDFYAEELKLREAFAYPPFRQLIKLTFRHKDKAKGAYAARVTAEKLKLALGRIKNGREDFRIIEAVPAFISKEKERFQYNIFIKARPGAENLSELLKYAGSNWLIDVDPRSLL